MQNAVLEVRGLVKHFPARGRAGAGRGPIRAVDGISFILQSGETLAIVGESGSGKSTLARTVCALEVPTAGRVLFRGSDIFAFSPKELRSWRKKVQIIFQDPLACLDPRMAAGRAISEPWRIHQGLVSRKERHSEVALLLKKVGLPPTIADRYPHQLSGGQRQRVAIARALALRPEVLVCDEAVSSLDASIQVQIVDLLRDIQQELGLACIFITHDLGLVSRLADRVAVMYCGKIVEVGSQRSIMGDAQHPYTQALMSAVMPPDPDHPRRPIVLRGEPPDPSAPPSGCRFRTRCWKAVSECEASEPDLIERNGGGRLVACHLVSPAGNPGNTSCQ